MSGPSAAALAERLNDVIAEMKADEGGTPVDHVNALAGILEGLRALPPRDVSGQVGPDESTLTQAQLDKAGAAADLLHDLCAEIGGSAPEFDYIANAAHYLGCIVSTEDED